jgi:hypothetical protein
MSKAKQLDPLTPRPNLDFSKGVRGKYAGLPKQGTNVIILDPDLLDTFPDSASANEALRGLKKIATRSAVRPRKIASASQ